ncbi:MAG: ABC transporter ATP-binding protein [Alkalispirochaetaceae bacterium]
MNNPVVEMRGITKRFGEFVANDRIDLTVHKGEIHALLGENGAGKTTLMKVLYGLLQPEEGKIFVQGEQVEMENPNVAIGHGIGMVHQHFMLVQPFTVAENIILGQETVWKAGILDRTRAVKDVQELSERYGLKVDPTRKIQDISVGMQQRVEILKALYRGADILILDEPTAVLTPQEIEELVKIMTSLTEEGKTIIVITHKLKEIKMVADNCTIIRRGRYIDTVSVPETTERELASKMVGREIQLEVKKEKANPGEVALAIEDLVVKDSRGINAVDGFSLEVMKGEILALAGIDGNGQTELVEALTGIREVASGRFLVAGRELQNATPREIFRCGLASIPEDRQRRGLVLDYTVAENLVLQIYGEEPYSRRGVLDRDAISGYAKKLIEDFDVRPPEEGYLARELSGGNQQKVIIAREVSHDPDVLVASQPTRGLDVGAIEYVHAALVEQRDRGRAVFLVSLDLDEVLNVADRVAVIYDGKVVGIRNVSDTDEHELGLMMAGGGAGNE